MKNKLQRKIVATGIAGALLLAAGCSGTLYEDYEYVDPGILPAKEEGVDYSPLKPYDETVTVNVIGIEYEAIGDVPSIYNGKASGPRNNAFNDAALQYLNIKLNYVSTTSGENYETRLNTLIAANDVPDVFITSSDTTFENLRRTGLIADIAPTFWYLNDAMQEFYLDELYYPAIETCMQGGKLYAFPNVDNPNEAAQKIYIRKDWLEIAGKEVPSTYEELVDVARAFKASAAEIAATETGVSAQEIVPIGITREITTKGNNTAQGFFNLFGAQPGAYFEEDGKVVDSNTSEEMKRALDELRKLYEEGLIDKEFYTDTDASVSNDIVAGKVGIVSGMWHAATYPLQSSVSNEYTPGAEWIGIELPAVDGEATVPVVDAMRMQSYAMVSSKCAHPDALVKLVNLFYDMFYSNTAQETYGSLATPEGGFFYSWVPAKVWYTPYSMQSYYRVNEVFDELWNAGFRIDDATLSQMAGKDFDWKGYYVQMSSGAYAEIFNKLMVRERDNGFKLGYPYMQAIREGKKSAEMSVFEKSGYGIYEQAISDTGGYAYVSQLSSGEKQCKREVFYGAQMPAMQNYGEYLNSYMKQYFLGVITGSEKLSDWNTFVKNYNANGGSAVLHQVQQWYDSTQSGGDLI